MFSQDEILQTLNFFLPIALNRDRKEGGILQKPAINMGQEPTSFLRIYTDNLIKLF